MSARAGLAVSGAAIGQLALGVIDVLLADGTPGVSVLGLGFVAITIASLTPWARAR